MLQLSILALPFSCQPDNAEGGVKNPDASHDSNESAVEECVAPTLTLSTTLVEFGDLEPDASASQTVVLANAVPAGSNAADVAVLGIGGDGISGIAIEGGHWGDFEVTWSEADISCDNTESSRGTGKSDTASPLSAAPPGDSAWTPTEAPTVIELAGGCSLPVTVTARATEPGELWGSLVVRTVTEGKADTLGIPEYARDEADFVQQVYLHASSDTGGRLVFDPPVGDFGEPALGIEEISTISLYNYGTSALTLGEIGLGDDCPTEFALAAAPSPGTVLTRGESVPLTISFVPTLDMATRCAVMVASDDPEQPAATAVFLAYVPENSGDVDVDDDADGHSELEGDCDDANAATFPNAVELCDDVDSDCDGLKDGASRCIPVETAPMIVGLLETQPDACYEHSFIDVSVRVYDPDGDEWTVQWGDASNTRMFGDDTAASTTWQCPDVEAGSPGFFDTLYTLVTDTSGMQSWDETRVSVYRDNNRFTEDACL